MTTVIPTVSIATPRGQAVVEVEIVMTQDAIERGLMYRTYLPYNAGMLFLMDREAHWAFYMRNTLIPLDMIYIGRDLAVAGVIHGAAPCTEDRRGVGRPSLYVLEVNAGWAAAHQIYAGAKVRPGYYLKKSSTRSADGAIPAALPVRSSLPTE